MTAETGTEQTGAPTGETYRRSEALLVRQAAGEVLILAPGAAELVRLSGTGSVLWELVEDAVTLEALTTQLAAIFDVDAARIRADIEPLVDELVRRGILELR